MVLKATVMMVSKAYVMFPEKYPWQSLLLRKLQYVEFLT